MNKYETVFIINPSIEDDGVKALIEKFSNLINNDGKVEEVKELGKKKLAYEVRGNQEGNYAVFKFDGKAEDISDLERNYRIDDNVIKFMTIKMDCEAEEEPETMEDEDDMEMYKVVRILKNMDLNKEIKDYFYNNFKYFEKQTNKYLKQKKK